MSRRDEYITLRVTRVEKAKIAKAAAGHGLTTGDYARNVLLQQPTPATPDSYATLATANSHLNTRVEGLESEMKKLARKVARDLGKEPHGDSDK